MEFDPEKLVKSPFVLGAAGALITALKFTPGASNGERFVNVIAGSAAAGIVAPAISEWFHWTSQTYLNVAAFMLGLVGMSLAAALLDGIRQTPVGQIITGWISRKP